MKLTDYTDAAIQRFAGSTIFGRGYGYYEEGMVMSLQKTRKRTGLVNGQFQLSVRSYQSHFPLETRLTGTSRKAVFSSRKP